MVAGIYAGLLARPARIEPKYFYDRLGSALFTAICELDEYYPTRVEAGVLARSCPAIAATIGRAGALIDLGAGDCRKAARLLPEFAPRMYVPVDISIDFVRDAAAAIARAHPGLEVLPLGRDFTTDWSLPKEVPSSDRVFFYPGSSIGNFTPEESAGFLERVRGLCTDGWLLIGVDLVKEAGVLERAYDDALGVTAAFNRNVLRHLNRIAATDFDPQAWRHVALFDPVASRIEMHLESIGAQAVRWPQGERRFADGERIHTENSYKYRRERFDALLRESGWTPAGFWTDPDHWFGVFLARARP
ncbi:MAG: L-histidine N(alpha)-methyltransferase [Burkholderiaceae bacterium]|nr:L-histidine N(alpha)-methyltransferase [Burkholderiaceae bacterium]